MLNMPCDCVCRNAHLSQPVATPACSTPSGSLRRRPPISHSPSLLRARVCFRAPQVGEEHFDLLDEATEEEEDMLDEATCLTSTSRLGCQIILRKELDGMEIALPAYSRNYYVDGHVPEPH